MFIKNNKLPPKLVLAIELTIIIAILTPLGYGFQSLFIQYANKSYALGSAIGSIFSCGLFLAFARELYLARKPWVRKIFMIYIGLGVLTLIFKIVHFSTLDNDTLSYTLINDFFNLVIGVICAVIFYLMFNKEVAQVFLSNKE